MNIILSGVTGSTAYGLNHADSDIDMKGVYVAPFRDVIGLDGAVVVSETKTHHDPDKEYHEVGKFLKLALKCNPTILETLFLDEYEKRTLTGQVMTDSRSYCLSEPAIRGSYGAYAKAQADRLIRRNEEGKEGFSSDIKARTEKHGRHCIRLLIQGTQLLTDGEMSINVADKRDYLFEMGELAGKSPEAFYKHYKVLANEFDAIETKLPKLPQRDRINGLLVFIRMFEKENVGGV